MKLEGKDKEKDFSEDLSLFEATGFSMWPFLKEGEKLIIKKTSAGNLKVGDVILYHSNNRMVCHRLVKKIVCEDGYLLYARGDASSGLEELVTKDILIGKVIGILKNGRIISFTGGWHHFTNWFIVQFGPFLRMEIKLIKWLIISVRSLVRRRKILRWEDDKQNISY